MARGRRRSSLARASGEPMNAEHAKWIVSSAEQARRREEEYRRFRNAGSPGQRQFEEASGMSRRCHTRHRKGIVRRWKAPASARA